MGCAAVMAVFETIEKRRLLERVKTLSAHLFKTLQGWRERVPGIREIRGCGFMVGLELEGDGRPIVDACRAKRLLINCTQERVLRLLPALTITKAELDRGLAILRDVLVEHGAASAVR